MADKKPELDVDERRNKMLELLNEKGKIKVADLSKHFGISEVTIRNDLAELEMKGMLDRVHGGAVSAYRAYYNMSLQERMNTNKKEKLQIAAEISGLISDGDTLMINSGTTTFYVLKELKSKRNLTIVTNSIAIAQEAGLSINSHVILLGGNFNFQYQFTYGDDTLNQLEKYKADKFIMAVDGIHHNVGLSTHHHLEAEVNRQMIKRVNTTIVAADYTKIGRTGFTHFSPISSVDMLITNKIANGNHISMIKDKGVEVRLV
jgi:DeoR/GlpR family transcriptional regulator of sugar metabolism